jgi:ZIP family zinc transporter
MQALGWGLAAAAALPLGAVAGASFRLSRRVVAGFMAFGAGTLIAALGLVLMKQAQELGRLDYVAAGFLAGALLYTAADLLIRRWVGGHRARIRHTERVGLGIAAGSFIDNIPEGAVIGMGVGAAGVDAALLVAVFASNFPEALSSAARMREARRSPGYTIALWCAIGCTAALASVAGHLAFGGAGGTSVALANSFAAGAILAMLADTLIPEAYEAAHDYSGLITALGFLVAVALHNA